MARILVPTPLRSCTDGHAQVEVGGNTVAASIQSLVEAYPRLQSQLFDDSGVLRSFVNLFLNDEDVRMLGGNGTLVGPADTIEILPAIAGGSGAPEDFASRKRRLENAIEHISVADLASGMFKDCLRIDVRGSEEWVEGHIPDAIHIDRGFLELSVEQAVPDRSRAIVVYCQSGTRSLLAADTLLNMGYLRVRSLAGGIQAWKAAGLETVVPARLSEGQKRRYSRHLTIPEIGPEGQKRLGQAKVLMIGAGGLGCPSALYLAAAGIGELTIVDDDIIDESNLQRQVLYTPGMVGAPKAETAKDVLGTFNPLIKVHALRTRLNAQTAIELFPHFDVIVDGTDNFTSRYIINDAAVACRKPVVHGAIYRFDGQISVFGLPGKACYRCFSPEAPPPELAPSCAQGGVLGILPGTVGLLMATEVIKLLLGIGDSLANRIIHYDALGAKFRELKIGQRADCPTCGTIHHASKVAA